jgi:hypothetical protein
VVAGLDVAEVAAITGKRPGNVRVLAHRALRHLAERLDDVFPPEMPDIPYDTAERLLAGLLDPEDAPPGYAEVARVLRAAAGPPCPDELAGQPAALATFRRTRHRARVRSRLVTVALAGTLALGGLWIADGARSPLGLLSPSGGPDSGGSGSRAPAAGPRSGGAGSAPALRAALPPVGTARGGGVGSPGLPSTRERAIARHGGGGASRGGGSARGVRPATSAKDRAAKPAKPGKAKTGKGEPGKGEPGKAGGADSGREVGEDRGK